jgi:hypothetical protein
MSLQFSGKRFVWLCFLVRKLLLAIDTIKLMVLPHMRERIILKTLIIANGRVANRHGNYLCAAICSRNFTPMVKKFRSLTIINSNSRFESANAKLLRKNDKEWKLSIKQDMMSITIAELRSLIYFFVTIYSHFVGLAAIGEP